MNEGGNPPSSSAPTDGPSQNAPPAAKPPAGDGCLDTVWNHPVTRIVVFTGLFLSLYVIAQSLLFQATHSVRQVPPAIVFTLIFVLEAVCVVLAAWIMATYAENRKMRDVGFTWRGIVTDTVIGAMVGMAVMSCVFGVLALFGDYMVSGTNIGFSPWLPLLLFLFVGVAEETFFRGFLFRVLEYRYGSLIAIVGSSILFGAVHMFDEINSSMSLAEKIAGPLFISFEAGILLSAAYIATRRLWMGIGIHWAWNYFEGPMYGATVSGTALTGSLVKSTVKGPFLITGGGFGPEASIVSLIICTLMGLLLLRVAVRAGQWKPIGQWQPATVSAGKT
jgi:uncharacterized protein